jgi:two-component system nitrogen regulation response regulator GlnG
MSSHGREVWIIDDDASIRRVLAHALAREDRTVREWPSADEALAAIDGGAAADVILTDLRMPGRSGLDLLETLASNAASCPVVVMTAFADLDNSVRALKHGAFELLPKPFDIDEACALVDRALAAPPRDRPGTGADKAPSLIGSAPAMKQLFRLIGRLADTELPVLLVGESGTGKERIARALHETSPRAAGPFVALNVAAIPGDLLESELFGHEQGAFSGADRARPGYFEQAGGGTLFLDEIGDMPAALQTRLLRVLADGDFHRLGGREARRADVRLIAATHHDLRLAVAEGRFREDLFHRLDVVELRVPPLRERRADIALLLDHYLDEAAAELGTSPKRPDADALRRLAAHDWPGNVRELVNLCRRLTALVPGSVIHAGDLPALGDDAGNLTGDLTGDWTGDWTGDLTGDWTGALREWARLRMDEAPGAVLAEARERLERALIDEALQAAGGRRAEAARLLGMGRNTLARKRARAGPGQNDGD